MTKPLILILLLSGCSTEGDTLFSLVDVNGIDAETWEKVEAGAHEWAVLDLYLDPDGEPIYIRVEDDVDGAAGLAHIGNREIFLNSLFPARLKGAAVHEFGHVLLETPNHLPPKLGVMSPHCNVTGLPLASLRR